MSGVFVPWVPLRTGEVGSRDSWWRDSFFANIGVFWVPYIHDTLGLGYLSSNTHKPRWVLFSKHRNFCFNESSLFTWFFWERENWQFFLRVLATEGAVLEVYSIIWAEHNMEKTLYNSLCLGYIRDYFTYRTFIGSVSYYPFTQKKPGKQPVS